MEINSEKEILRVSGIVRPEDISPVYTILSEKIADSRIRAVQDVLTEGDVVAVKVIEIDGNGKMRLSRKIALRDQPALAAQEKLKNPNAANPPRE